MPAVGIECAAVAWAHEELGFREPSDRASEMGAIDREDLERITGHPAHPARYSRGFTVPGLSVRVYILAQPGLVFRIVSQIPERYPVEPRESSSGRQDVAENRYREDSHTDGVDSQSEAKEKGSTGSLFG